MQRTPHPIDCHVGACVRTRRVQAGISQVQLGSALGVTYQQVQKYERGTNRVSASRLQQLGHVLGVPVTAFYEGFISEADDTGVNVGFSQMNSDLTHFLATREGTRLARAFSRVGNIRTRRQIINLVRVLAEATAE